MPRNILTLGATGLLAGTILVGSSYAADYADKLAEAQEAFVAAYQENDADKMADLFAEDAHFAGVVTPQWLIGRERIRKAWAEFFIAYPQSDVLIYKFEDSQRELVSDGSSDDGASTFIESGCLIMDLKRPDGTVVRPLTRYNRTWICTPEGCKMNQMHDSVPGGSEQLVEPLDKRENCYSE